MLLTATALTHIIVRKKTLHQININPQYFAIIVAPLRIFTYFKSRLQCVKMTIEYLLNTR